MLMQFGPSLPSVLRELGLIFISHMHADHMCGIFRVLTERGKLTSMPIAVHGPSYLDVALNMYSQIIAPLNYTFTHCEDPLMLPYMTHVL
jgi:ribonuclease BN (tRNA processing enzyme)